MDTSLILTILISFIYLLRLLYLNNAIILLVRKKKDDFIELINFEKNLSILKSACNLEINEINSFLNKEKKLMGFQVIILSIVVGAFFNFFPITFFIIELVFILMYLFSFYTSIKHLEISLDFFNECSEELAARKN